MAPPSQRQNDMSSFGYLGAFFRGSAPFVYFDLSIGDNPLAFTPLNGGEPIIRPSMGTGRLRDPALIQGDGFEKGRKWYLLGTDLDIDVYNHNWDLSGRYGSRSILVWESEDLIHWTGERLVELEGPTAGMVWAPDALWDSGKQMYLVHWSSHFFAEDDPEHERISTLSCIRYAYTSDFKTFTVAADFVKTPDTAIIDLALLHLGGDSYLRFLKNGTTSDSKITSYVYMEKTTTGLQGHWERPGGPDAYIYPNCEGPYAWRDNTDPGKAYLLLDDIDLPHPQYIPFEATDFDSQTSWRKCDASRFPGSRRHGSVVALTKELHTALEKHFSVA